MRKVITYGTFDTFHYGHLELFRKAKILGDHLTVGLSTDIFNTQKGKSTMFNYTQRKEWLESIKYIDEIIPEESWDQKYTDVKKHKIDTFVMGSDWSGKFDDIGCDFIYLDRTDYISSSDIKRIYTNNLISDICNNNLKEKQLKSLKILKIILSEFKKRDITYWLGYGTLIGCLRHGGFIPWDDDIDICIPESNISKLLSIGSGIKIERSKNSYILHVARSEKIGHHIDIFVLPENTQKNIEMTESEIYPLKIAKFNNIKCNIPNNPNEFFKRKYGSVDPMDKCLVWNHDLNNMWENGFDIFKYQIEFNSLDEKWKKYII